MTQTFERYTTILLNELLTGYCLLETYLVGTGVQQSMGVQLHTCLQNLRTWLLIEPQPLSVCPVDRLHSWNMNQLRTPISEDGSVYQLALSTLLSTTGLGNFSQQVLS